MTDRRCRRSAGGQGVIGPGIPTRQLLEHLGGEALDVLRRGPEHDEDALDLLDPDEGQEGVGELGLRLGLHLGGVAGCREDLGGLVGGRHPVGHLERQDNVVPSQLLVHVLGRGIDDHLGGRRGIVGPVGRHADTPHGRNDVGRLLRHLDERIHELPTGCHHHHVDTARQVHTSLPWGIGAFREHRRTVAERSI